MNEFAVVVRGGGPCGIAAATALKRSGVNVTLITRSSTTPSAPRLETVPGLEVIAAAFPRLPLDESSGIHLHAGGISHWSEEPVEIPRGHIIDRPVFDLALRRLALAESIAMQEFHTSRPEVRWEVLATGRHGAGARLRLTQWRQIAISSEIEPSGPLPAVWTESLEEGWLSLIRSGRRCILTAFTSPSGAVGNPRDTFEKMLRSSRLQRLAQASCRGVISCCECTPSINQMLERPAAILAGDAAMARDPLCAQGLTAAISDGNAACAAIMTVLENSLAGDLVREFSRQRYHLAAQRHVRNLEETYRAAGRDGPWWIARHSAFREPESALPVDLRHWHPRQTLVRSRRWNVEKQAVLHNGRIGLQETLIPLDAGQEPVAWLHQAPLPKLLQYAATPIQAGELASCWIRHELLPASRIPEAMRWLVEHRILVSENHRNDLPAIDIP